MTDYALNTAEFILYKSFIALADFLVAGHTFHVGMFTGQFKPRFIMVESFDRPGLEPMALCAINYAINSKLPFMHVLMATCAGRG